MAKTRPQKEETVTKLSEKLSRAKAVVLADYQQAGTSGSKGMTMAQLSALRSQLSELESEFIVTKNTLLKLAFEKSDLRSPTSDLWSGPTATLLAYDDEISPIKTLVKALKDNAVGKIKAGFLGTEVLDDARVNQLSLLPTKDELRGKTVGVLAAPLQGMVSVLQGNLRNLVYAISEIQIRQLAEKGGE